jgi:hypothetical protein
LSIVGLSTSLLFTSVVYNNWDMNVGEKGWHLIGCFFSSAPKKVHYRYKMNKKKYLKNLLLTLRKSMSWVIKVPSVLWNSNIIISSWIFDVIVSCTTSPPWKNTKKKIHRLEIWNENFCLFHATQASVTTTDCPSSYHIKEEEKNSIFRVVWLIKTMWC